MKKYGRNISTWIPRSSKWTGNLMNLASNCRHDFSKMWFWVDLVKKWVANSTKICLHLHILQIYIYGTYGWQSYTLFNPATQWQISLLSNKHLPFWLLVKNLKKRSFGARSLNQSWQFLGFFDPYLFSWSCAPPPNWQKHLSRGGAQDLENK